MNKRGFTLIELIAIMALLGIISVLILPQIGNDIKERKETQYQNILKVIESSAKVYYAENEETTKVLLSTLVDEDYLSSNLTDPRSGDPITGCVYIYLDSDGFNKFIYMDDLNNCSSSQFYYSLVVKPMDGLYNGSTDNVSYQLEKAGTQTVNNPTRDGYSFSGWSYNCTGCSISNEVFTMGESNVVLTATWEPNTYTLTSDLDGGTIGQAPPTSAAYKSLIQLGSPTKTDYTFINWEVVSGNESTISSNVLTMGKENTVIKANYEQNSYTKNTNTCDRTIATYNKTTKSCARSVATYIRTKKTCICNGDVCGWVTSTSTVTSCSVTSMFTCNTFYQDGSYTSACTVDSYNYYFNTSTSSSTTCSTTSSFSCSSSTYGWSYVSACSIGTYNYAFTTSSIPTNQCSETTAFTCNETTYQGSYISCIIN